MDTEETTELSADTAPNPPLDTLPAAGDVAPAAEPAGPPPAPDPSWSRRTFLRAAALGAAVAGAMLVDRDKAGGLHFGGAEALANDLSTSPCTAQDVEIIGAGIVENEPCVCASGGTFSATVQFTVRNNTSTGRYCIGLHLVSAVDANGNVIVAGQDVLLHNVDAQGNILTTSTAPGKSGGNPFQETTMAGTITNFPCNSGGTLICFGSAGVTTGKCAAGTCTTVSWNTSTGAANCTAPDQKPPGGQCRHQQVCVQGFGGTLMCADANCVNTSSAPCTAQCGGTLNLQAAAAGASKGATLNSYTWALTAPDGTSAGSAGPGASSPQCFAVSNPQQGTYILTITDSKGCTRTAAALCNVSSITAGIALASGQNTTCGSGNLTFQGSVTGCSSSATPSYAWVGATPKATDSSQADYSANPDSTCHTVSVTVTCGNCQDTKSMNVTQCISSTVNTGACP